MAFGCKITRVRILAFKGENWFKEDVYLLPRCELKKNREKEEEYYT